MENLPPDITLDILSRLPVESVLLCKQVCKNWRNLFRLSRNTNFGDVHLCRQLLQPDDDPSCTGAAKVGRVGLLFSICFGKGEFLRGERLYGRFYYYGGDYNEIKNIGHQQLSSYKKLARVNHHAIKMSHQYALIGSRNGLVCFNMPHGFSDPTYICNPITSEYVNLPRFPNVPGRRKDRMSTGFGYHTLTNQYKVVRIYYPNRTSAGQIQVYTLGAGSGWRNKEEITSILSPAPGVLLNGALHWMDYGLNILAFDLVNEEFSFLSSPPPCLIHNRVDQFYELQVLGGCLCVIHQERSQRVDIWLLKRNKNSSNDTEEHWSKDFSIPLGSDDATNYYEPFALTKSSEVLLWFNDKILAYYDPKTSTLQKLWDHGKERVECQAIFHMNSFVSLKAIGEKSKRRRYRIS